MTTYCIVNTNDITNTMLDEAVSEMKSLRYSLDGTKAILKFNIQFPNSMQGYTKYTLEQILTILNGAEWTILE